MVNLLVMRGGKLNAEFIVRLFEWSILNNIAENVIAMWSVFFCWINTPHCNTTKHFQRKSSYWSFILPHATHIHVFKFSHSMFEKYFSLYEKEKTLKCQQITLEFHSVNFHVTLLFCNFKKNISFIQVRLWGIYLLTLTDKFTLNTMSSRIFGGKTTL